MNRRQTKQTIIALLRNSELPGVRSGLMNMPRTGVVNALFSCLCHADEKVRWHAVSGFGFLVPAIGAEKREDARVIMRRFLWMLNDESGGIGWGVPEAMGEVMHHSDFLAVEYLHMLVSYTMDDGPELFQDGNFLELAQLQEGVLWGLCRVAPKRAADLAGLKISDHIGRYFNSSNASVRGMACRLAGMLQLSEFAGRLEDGLTDHAALRYYDNGLFRDTTVAALAQTALAAVSRKDRALS